MELKWLEDFLILLEKGSFSRAAALRHITQPAFSRRIKALEAWLGVELIDRRSQPVRLTPVARQHEAEIRQLVERCYALREQLRAAAEITRPRVVFTAQHTLTATLMPPLLRRLEAELEHLAYRVRSSNRDTCVMQFALGEADFLLCYGSDKPPGLANVPTRVLGLGHDRLLPVTAGEQICSWLDGGRLPLLGYPPGSYLGQLLRQQLLPGLSQRFAVELICESAFTVGLKEMALQGLGVVWLPQTLVDHELVTGRLVGLAESLGDCPLDIYLYGVAERVTPTVAAVWQRLEAFANVNSNG